MGTQQSSESTVPKKNVNKDDKKDKDDSKLLSISKIKDQGFFTHQAKGRQLPVPA